MRQCSEDIYFLKGYLNEKLTLKKERVWVDELRAGTHI